MSDNNSETSTTTNDEDWVESYRIYMGHFESDPQLNDPDVYDYTCLTLLQDSMMKALNDINQKIENYVEKNMKVA